MEPLKLLVYAKWGSGKTRLAATAAAVPALCPVALWSFDKSTSSIDKKKFPLDIYEISNPKELSAATASISEKKYKTIIIDTLTELHALMLTHAMQLNKTTAIAKSRDKSDFVPEPLDYGGAQNGVLQLIRKLRDWNLNIIALAQDCQISDGTGSTERILFNHGPRTAKSLSLAVPEFFDMIGYGTLNGKKFSVTFNSTSPLTMTKDRRACIPQPVDDPTLAKIYTAYTGGANGAIH